MRHSRLLPAVALLLFAAYSGVVAWAQTIGGSALISVTATSADVALPAATTTYPALMMTPAVGSAVQMWFLFCATSSCTALVTGPAIPANGICFPNMAASFTYVAAIASGAGPTVLYLTQLTQCPARF